MNVFQLHFFSEMAVSVLLVVFLLFSTSKVNGSCPANCSCTTDTSGSDINCNSRSLGHIPDALPNDTYNL